MQTLEILYQLAAEINEAWDNKEAVDWSEAEQLIYESKKIPAKILSAMPEVVDIIKYADSHDNWDNEEVARWPDVIRSKIEEFNKQ